MHNKQFVGEAVPSWGWYPGCVRPYSRVFPDGVRTHFGTNFGCFFARSSGCLVVKKLPTRPQLGSQDGAKIEKKSR